MAIAKQALKSKPVCKVTFALSADVVGDAKDIALLGEFNEWSAETATKLKKQKDGSYKATVELETGKEYAFRYLFNGTTWVNDEAADKYVPNGISYEENSVVVL
ncbi:MAG: isoamylase early set domain-containing protein [Spirosomaceae bacterium]|jgi:1,4-alpha-glucan branching enzyme|nr:isoamylase early set domain-containing protein [Spirosomataceae bacterium]